MLPGRQDHEIYQGDDYEFFVRLQSRNSDGTLGDWLDLTGYTITAEIRQSESSTSTLLATFGVVLGNQASSDTKGSFFLTLSNTITNGLVATPSNLPESGYWWDMQLTAPDSKKRTYLKGRVTVENDVTA